MRLFAAAVAALFVAVATSSCDPPVFNLRRFGYDSRAIDATVAARMTPSSWRPGCPVALADLRYVTLDYYGFDGVDHKGEMVLNASAVEPVMSVFKTMFLERFPVERMQLVDDYGGDDDASVEANNTSAFNCRAATGSSSFSQHAYGLAVDINPRQNPYRYSDGHVMFPDAAPYLDRGRTDAGMIHADDVVDRGFTAIGWGWGGRFTGAVKDYQHFSSNGR